MLASSAATAKFCPSCLTIKARQILYSVVTCSVPVDCIPKPTGGSRHVITKSPFLFIFYPKWIICIFTFSIYVPRLVRDRLDKSVMTSQNQQKTIVVGAGPVGSLAALYAAQRGDNVEIYELRGGECRIPVFQDCFADSILDLRDPATVPLNFTKSINLALSERGINAIRHANRPDLLHSIRQDTIPMRGRMIHGEKNGRMSQESQAYDIHGRVRMNAVKKSLLLTIPVHQCLRPRRTK